MLVLSRKSGETIYAGDITITVVRMSGNVVRLGIDAPTHVTIVRGELIGVTDEAGAGRHSVTGDVPQPAPA